MWGRILVTLCIAFLTGCSGWGKTPSSEQPVVALGQYAPPAQPTPRLRVAVPDLAINNAKGTAADVDLTAVASDELVSLLDASMRFDLIERNHLRQLLVEQGQLDIVQPGKLVHPAPVHGFDYLLVGQIDDLSVTKEPPPDKASIAGVEQMLGIGGSYVPRLIATAKVDLWLIDPGTGAVDVAGKSEFHRIATPKSMGLQMTAEQLAKAPQAQLSPSDTRRVLRLILDEVLRPILPRVDRFASTLPPQTRSLANSLASPTNGPPSTQAATLICPECGFRVPADSEFCPNCGHKLK